MKQCSEQTLACGVSSGTSTQGIDTPNGAHNTQVTQTSQEQPTHIWHQYHISQRFHNPLSFPLSPRLPVLNPSIETISSALERLLLHMLPLPVHYLRYVVCENASFIASKSVELPPIFLYRGKLPLLSPPHPPHTYTTQLAPQPSTLMRLTVIENCFSSSWSRTLF